MSECRGLLIDSCGSTAVVALFDGARVVAQGDVEGRGFSAKWPGMLRGLLAEAGWELGDLKVIGVVHGPGSFTGVRVGVAAAKGLCEAVGTVVVAVSRLEVLAAMGGVGAVAVLDAGRGEFYVRDGGVEGLMALEEVVALAAGREVVAVEARVAEALGVEAREVDVMAAVALVVSRWKAGAVDDVAALDANYVRGERDIYASKTGLAQRAGAAKQAVA